MTLKKLYFLHTWCLIFPTFKCILLESEIYKRLPVQDRIKDQMNVFSSDSFLTSRQGILLMTAEREHEPLRRASGPRFLAHLGLRCSVAALVEGIVLWIESSRICCGSANRRPCSCCKQFGKGKIALHLLWLGSTFLSKIAAVLQQNHSLRKTHKKKNINNSYYFLELLGGIIELIGNTNLASISIVFFFFAWNT